MKHRWKLLGVTFVIACGLGFAPHFHWQNTEAQEKAPPEKPAVATQDFVEEEFPYSIDELRDHLLRQFDSESRNYFDDYNRAIYDLPEKVLSYKDMSPEAYKQFMALPLVKPGKFYVFYGAYPTKQKEIAAITQVSVIGVDNPALVRYAAIPQNERAYDLYIWSPDTPYWHSEYALGDIRLPFRTYFILHLSEVDAGRTKLEIIEHKPVVRMGRKVSVDEHGNIQEFEVRPVAPTTRERLLLMSCIHQFIERGVPTRAQFNCKDNPDKPAP